MIYSSEEQTLNLVPTPSNEESNTFCYACISVFSESFWSNPIPFGYAAYGYRGVVYVLLFDGECQPLTYLTCTGARGISLYFRLNYKVLPAVYQQSICGLWTTCLFIWFLTVLRWLLTQHHPLPSPTSTEVAALLKLYQADRGYIMNKCLHDGPLKETSNYYVKVTLSVRRQQCNYSRYCTRGSGWVLVWRLRWLLSMLFFSEAAGKDEAWSWSEESECAALKQSRISVRVSHGWDVPIHSLLEGCLSS